MTIFEKEMRDQRIVVAASFVLFVATGLLWYLLGTGWIGGLSLFTGGLTLGGAFLYLLARFIGRANRLTWIAIATGIFIGYFASQAVFDLRLYEFPGETVFGAFLGSILFALRLAMLELR